MIIVRLAGGLGNQLFQYAFGQALAKRKATKVVFDRTFHLNDKKRNYQLKEFKLKIKTLPYWLGLCLFLVEKFLLKNKNTFKENKGYKYNKRVFDSKYIYYDGYWQSFKYFDELRSVLKKEIKLKDKKTLINNYFFKKIKKSNSIAIHIRRGDYCTPELSKIYYDNICTLNYYNRAIKEISSKIKSPVYFIFSDDLFWVRNNLKINTEHYFVAGLKSDIQEFELMKNCKHYIIANSSFSWWAAWLGEKKQSIVVAPKTWIANEQNNFSDLLPRNWRWL